MNILTLYRDKAAALREEHWRVAMHGKQSASHCIRCGKCERVCPQHIPIRAELAKVAETFGR